MATISRGLLDDFVLERAALTKSCKALAEEILKSYEGDLDDYDALFDHCFAMLDEICLAATDVAAVIEGELYQAVYEYSNSEVFRPVYSSGYTSKSVEESLHAFLTIYSSNKNIDALSGKMAQRVGMEIDHAIAHCAIDNERLDKKQKKWARIPSSVNPCKFCCMLASRGFEPGYNSYEAARGKIGSHYGECKCTIIQGYAGDDVEGYNPEAFYRQWQKLEKIDKREDLSQDEKEVLRLVAADSEQKFNLEQSKELAVKLGEVMSQRKDAFKDGGFTKEGYEKTVEAWIKDIGKLYGMDLSGEYLSGQKKRSAAPDGYELWAATRLRSRYKTMQFLGEDYSRTKGNPDLLIDGRYVEIKTPEIVGNIRDKVHEAYVQCINRGGKNALIILSPLRLEELDDRYIRFSYSTIRRKQKNGQDISAIVIDGNLNLVDCP